MDSSSTSPSPYAFPLHPKDYAPEPVPSIQEWRQLWKAWELVTLKMIPNEALHEKPIPLRNELIFYLGHIPTFEDIHLSRATKEPPIEPVYYQTIFERGIDPDVDNPDNCHDHSEVPDTWPSLDEILSFREKVCARIEALYQTDKPWSDRTIGRALWIGFEHEGLHLETFLWMSILSPNVQPPPGVERPDFEGMAREAAGQRVENQWFPVKARTFPIGIDDAEDDSGDGYFAWDNERGPYDAVVHGFEAQARPVCIGEYAKYLVETSKTDNIPVSWTRTTTPLTNGHGSSGDAVENFIGNLTIKTVFGPVPLKLAVDWPVYISYNDATAYADWAGARLPTLHEARSIHRQVEEEKAKDNNDLPRDQVPTSSREDIYIDMTGYNTGFNHFHPTPVTHKGNQLCGQSDLGGAYEWTSSNFAPQPGFKPMDIYPGYSADFMDEKHIVVVGGTWALHPRISGKRTFLNWWQKNYPYPWVTPRLVRDV
ncbi:hypothetical protein SI65_00931 [Aspergillus cristatus]|uniref:Sulfatase-modifying factor enzyme domain-containing protein n=1 Tax=Aspergillus cristatus TaxID=573508 RepID=A0A1E3BQV1_ASPCR|nr:hypothetical protein SI65_00931 [Aspergillus cristatus]